MHEMSIAVNVVEIVAEQMAGRSGRVTGVLLEVGALSGVEPSAVAFCYEAAAAGTRAEGSVLTVRAIPAAARCGECGHGFEPLSRHFVCPECGAMGPELTAGEELAVAEITIDDEGDPEGNDVS